MVSNREPATEKRVEFARRQLREIPAGELRRDGDAWVDGSGERFVVVPSHVDLVEPASTGCVAFVVEDSFIVPLRPAGWVEPAPVSREFGSIGGREVRR